jgi:hypothetical protein
MKLKMLGVLCMKFFEYRQRKAFERYIRYRKDKTIVRKRLRVRKTDPGIKASLSHISLQTRNPCKQAPPTPR